MVIKGQVQVNMKLVGGINLDLLKEEPISGNAIVFIKHISGLEYLDCRFNVKPYRTGWVYYDLENESQSYSRKIPVRDLELVVEDARNQERERLSDLVSSQYPSGDSHYYVVGIAEFNGDGRPEISELVTLVAYKYSQMRKDYDGTFYIS